MEQAPPSYNAANYSTAADYAAFPATAPQQYGYEPPKGTPGAPPPAYPAQSYPPQSYPPAPPPGYQHSSGQVAPTTVIMTTQPRMNVMQCYREMPIRTQCIHCSADVVTATHFETGTFTWVACIVLWFVGCFLGCCFIPFCMDGCKDVIHTCPNCNHVVGRYSRM